MARRQDLMMVLILLGIFLTFIISTIMLYRWTFRGEGISLGSGGDRIAVVELEGVIVESKPIVRQLDRYRKDESAKGLIIRINSPGGGVAASEEIYKALVRVREAGKFVVASMGTVAASGGYYVACGADTIMANSGTTTGSIGVIAEVPNFQRLLDKIGVSMTVIKSGKFKDTGSPFRTLTGEERRYLQKWIDDAYEQFVGVVARERGMTLEEVKKHADGRVYTGNQASRIGLVDLIGTYHDAVRLAGVVTDLGPHPKILQERKRKRSVLDLLLDEATALLGGWRSMPSLKYQFVLN